MGASSSTWPNPAPDRSTPTSFAPTASATATNASSKPSSSTKSKPAPPTSTAASLSPPRRGEPSKNLHDELDRLHTAIHQHTKDLTRQQGALKAQQTKLLQAHCAGAIPLDLLKTEQTRITRELAAITKELHSLTSNHHAVKHHLTQALDLLQDCHHLYTRAPAPLKKLLNTIFFDHTTVNPQDDDAPQPHRTATPHPAPPFNHLTNPALIHVATHAKAPPANAEGAQNHIHFGPVSCKTLVVGPTGFEPMTFWV